MLKQKIKTIFEALLYIMLTYWLIDSFFAFGFAPIFPDICYHLTHYK
ncbi:hypothetical protein ACS0TE_23605, partial [Escherichia coli]